MSCKGEDESYAGDEPTPSQCLIDTEKHIARTFFTPAHYRTINQSLASRWDRLHSLSAAMKLMEKYGVTLSPEEEQRLAGMDEAQQINALVMKMPQQSNEQFQQFFLQLQLLVSTATRVRRALEDGRPDLVEEALNDADSTGISSYILRMAIVQAGSEVQMLRAQYQAWMKESDAKCGKLIRGQEDAMSAQKKLAAAQAQLAIFTQGQNEKAKKVIMNFANQSDKGLISSSFHGWRTHTKQELLEREIKKDYVDRIDAAEKRLAEYKEAQLGNVRGVMMKKAYHNDQTLLGDALKYWREEVKEEKEKLHSADKVKELEEKLSNMKRNQSANTKSVVMKMNSDGEFALVSLVFAAFVTFHQDYQKNKEMESKVADAERKINKFMKAKSEGAKKIMEKMTGATDSGIIQMAFGGWKDVWEDAKKEAAMEEILNEHQQKMTAFNGRNKTNGHNVMDRARQHTEHAVLIRCMGAWRLDARMEATLKMFHAKIEAKRSQLVGVQHMFRRFANELEGNLKASADTSRDFMREGPPPGKKMMKNEGSVSLPDINQKPNSGRPQKPATPSTRVRTPTGSSR